MDKATQEVISKAAATIQSNIIQTLCDVYDLNYVSRTKNIKKEDMQEILQRLMTKMQKVFVDQIDSTVYYLMSNDIKKEEIKKEEIMKDK